MYLVCNEFVKYVKNNIKTSRVGCKMLRTFSRPSIQTIVLFTYIHNTQTKHEHSMKILVRGMQEKI